MKKILTFVICLFAYFVCEAQTYPIPSNIGGPTTLVKTPNYGGLQAGLIPFSFADTIAANAALTYGKNYNGFLIYTQTPQATWWRLADSSKWVMILPQGGGTPVSGQAWINPGNSNLFTDASLNGGFGTLGNNGVYFKTNGITRLYLDRNGIAPETGTSVGIGIDPSDSNRITYFSGGGGVNIYNSNGTLTNDRTLDGDNRSLLFDNVGSFTVNTSIGTQTGLLIDGVQTIIYSPDNTRYINVNNTATGIVGLTNLSTQTRLIGQDGANSAIGYITIGTGLSLSSGVLSNSGVVTTPTWQQTLTAGSILNVDNSVDVGGNDFEMNNAGEIFLNSNTGAGYSSAFISPQSLILTAAITSNGMGSDIGVFTDSLRFRPGLGNLLIDTLNNETFQNQLMGWTSTSGANRGKVGYITIGTGLSLSSGVLSATGGSGITIGSTTITSGTNTRILYNNSGVVGEYSVTGTGTTAVLSTSPTFTTSLLSPIVYGGSSSGGNLTIQSTSNGTKGKIFFGATSYVDEANTKNYLTGTTDVGGTAYGDASVILSLNNQTGAGTILGAYTSGAARFSIDQNGNTKQENGSLIGSASGTRDASSILEVRGTTGGVLMPRMTATQASAIGSPADGLIVYVTDTNGTFTAIGFWGRVSGAWTQL